MSDASAFTTDEIAQAFLSCGNELAARMLAELKLANPEGFAKAKRLITAGHRTELTVLFDADPDRPGHVVELALRSDLEQTTTLWRLRQRTTAPQTPGEG